MARRVLVVDDDHVSRQVLATILDLDELDVSVTADSAAAERRLAAEAFDVVVVDLHREPVPDVCRRLRATSSRADVTVVALADDTEPAVDDVVTISRPFSALDLIDLVEGSAARPRSRA